MKTGSAESFRNARRLYADTGSAKLTELCLVSKNAIALFIKGTGSFGPICLAL